MKKEIIINLSLLNLNVFTFSGIEKLVKKELKKLGYDTDNIIIDSDCMFSYDMTCLIASFTEIID